MDSPLNQDWLDEVARKRLPATEVDRWRRELIERPAEARRLDEELALNRLLDSLPRPSVSSDFTTRVMSGVRETPEQQSLVSRAWEDGVSRLRALKWALKWGMAPVLGVFRALSAHAVPLTVALVCVANALHFGWRRVQTHRHGVIARTAAEWSNAAAMPGVAALQDFEAIQWLETRSAPDDVALLQLLRDDAPGGVP
jgi:hypothetical protein